MNDFNTTKMYHCVGKTNTDIYCDLFLTADWKYINIVGKYYDNNEWFAVTLEKETFDETFNIEYTEEIEHTRMQMAIMQYKAQVVETHGETTEVNDWIDCLIKCLVK